LRLEETNNWGQSTLILLILLEIKTALRIMGSVYFFERMILTA